MLQMRVFNSIKAKAVIAFLIAGSVPMIVSMMIINQRSQDMLLKKTQSAFVDSVSVREALLNDHIEAYRRHAKIVAQFESVREFIEQPALDQGGGDELFIEAGSDIALIQKELWGESHHVFLVDLQGTIVLNAPDTGWESPKISVEDMRASAGPHMGESIVESEHFREALDATVVTGFFAIQEKGHFHVLVLSPIMDNAGDTVGLVGIEVSIDHMIGLLEREVGFDSSGRLYLATKDGRRVVHEAHGSDSTPHGSDSPQSVDNTNISLIKPGTVSSGWFEFVSGKEVFGVYQSSLLYPWVVCAEIDRADLEGPIHAQNMLFVFFSLMSVGVFAGTIVIVGRMFWNPLKRVVAAADRVADGDLWHEIEVTRTDEIGQLEGAVNAMRLSMKQQIDHLDALVAERTAELEHANEKLGHDSEHDGLTGLSNRQALRNQLETELAMYHEDHSHLISVLFFDFDRFKVVNDSLGHAAGDALLCSIADRFRVELRKIDLPARFGGDEFVVLLSAVETPQHALDAADRLLKIFEEAHVVDGHRIVSTASIGLVIADPRYTSADDIIRDADAAMYEAKLAGKNQVVVFDEQMLANAKHRLKLEEDLSKAIENNELRVMYQPVIGMEDMAVVGFEALIRWEHPELGLVSPVQFIPIAEDTGQIVEVGAWILREAVEQVIRWDNELNLEHELSINVNVAKGQLIHPEFLGLVKDVLESTGIAPHRLKIEITESTAIDPRHDMSIVIDRIRELGILIAMDDFGTGHSSLSLLHKFKFDILKIDQSFVQGMEESREMSAVLHSIIALAQNTGMKVVAEGAETEAQVACLISHECDMIQGYYFSRPLTPKDAGEFLAGPFNHKQAA